MKKFITRDNIIRVAAFVVTVATAVQVLLGQPF